jgi:small-conductance mechanosensitive channel
VRSLKNEMVSIPNTKLLGQEVMNYTRMAGTKGLIVYTSVGIGYDESQAQVEHLLVEAARLTSGVKATPAPFVLRRELGASDVRYELNAYSKPGIDPVGLRSRLNANILDQFHGAGVQIMTPNYIADPESPKIPEPPQAPLLDHA